MKTILIVLLVAQLAMLAMSASILDYLVDPSARDSDSAPSAAGDASSAAAAESARRNCLCNGPSCICCIDFNLTFVDLGGPGCVRMNYIGADEGIAINVSYGDSLLHSQTVRGPDPAPACLNIFSSIAQMCARFSHLLPTDDGLRGCVMLEPKLLGTTQIELPIGCFRMGPNGMAIAESNEDIIKEQIPSENNAPPAPADGSDDDDDDEDDTADPTAAAGTLGGYSTADILAAVSDSAEEGIALLSNWLGLAPSSASSAAAAAKPPAGNTEAPAEEAATEPSA